MPLLAQVACGLRMKRNVSLPLEVAPTELQHFPSATFLWKYQSGQVLAAMLVKIPKVHPD